MAGAALLDHFAALRDPRQSWKVVYPLPEVLLVVLCGTLAGARNLVEVAQWAGAKLDFLRRLLPFRRGIPSHDTLGDVLGALDAGLFSECFTAWVDGLRAGEPGFVAVEGKTSRRARRGEAHPLHLVSAWAGRQRSVLGQEATSAKSDEITAIPLLLERLELSRSDPSRRAGPRRRSRGAPSSASTRWAANARSPEPSAVGAPTTFWR